MIPASTYSICRRRNMPLTIPFTQGSFTGPARPRLNILERWLGVVGEEVRTAIAAGSVAEKSDTPLDEELESAVVAIGVLVGEFHSSWKNFLGLLSFSGTSGIVVAERVVRVRTWAAECGEVLTTLQRHTRRFSGELRINRVILEEIDLQAASLKLPLPAEFDLARIDRGLAEAARGEGVESEDLYEDLQKSGKI
jgi:hypothetical protein